MVIIVKKTRARTTASSADQSSTGDFGSMAIGEHSKWPTSGNIDEQNHKEFV